MCIRGSSWLIFNNIQQNTLKDLQRLEKSVRCRERKSKSAIGVSIIAKQLSTWERIPVFSRVLNLEKVSPNETNIISNIIYII